MPSYFLEDILTVLFNNLIIWILIHEIDCRLQLYFTAFTIFCPGFYWFCFFGDVGEGT